MYYEILAGQCLAGDNGSLQVEYAELSSLAEVRRLGERLGRQFYQICTGQHVMEVKWSHCSYVDIRISLDTSIALFIRERKPRRRVTVRELRSHNLNGGVTTTQAKHVYGIANPL
jgi:hypothetical protein